MSQQRKISNKVRIYHRYLGFFLAGVMGVYAISGIVLIFRDTDLFKIKKQYERQVAANLNAAQLGAEIKIKKLEFTSIDKEIANFKQGSYYTKTGKVFYTVKELPFFIDKMTHMHKAKSAEPLYFLNIFFGVSLLFFVLSAFWMFLPGSTIFRKGLYFAVGGIVLTLIVLFV